MIWDFLSSETADSVKKRKKLESVKQKS